MEMQYVYQIISLVLLIGVLIVFFYIPDRKEKKAQKELLDNLKRNDVVMTKNGIKGRILSVGEDTVIINVEPGKANLEIAKWAVMGVNNKKKG